MKIKILVAGDNDSRHQFFVSLGKIIKFEQAATSLNSLGTGTYKFKLEGHEIELMYLEDHAKVGKNFHRYAKGSVGIIFVDATDEVIDGLRATCGQDVPYAGYRGGGNPDPIKLLRILFERISAKREAAARAQHGQFQMPDVIKRDSEDAKKHGPSGP